MHLPLSREKEAHNAIASRGSTGKGYFTLAVQRNGNNRRSSCGAGSDLSPQEACDLLHKLITESIKVLCTLRIGRTGFQATGYGVVRVAPDDGIMVFSNPGSTASKCIQFDPALAIRRTYGDDRSIGEHPPALQNLPRLKAALSFAFENDTSVCLFELDQEEE